MKKVWLNKDGFQEMIWGELERIGLLKFAKNGNMKGIGGLSSKPKWDGEWTGLCWSNSSILLSEEGLKILKESDIKGWELA